MTGPSRVEELVGRMSARHPHRTALSGPDGDLDFAGLERRASALAGRLRPDGAVGHRVAVRMPRSVEQVVTVLACWKAGAVCVPVDPALPRLRAEHMMEAARCDLLIGPDERIETLGGRRTGADRGLAYVFFTSGSTGEPKAVGSPHSGIVNEARWTAEAFRLTEHDRGSWLSSPGFALTRWELWSSLAAGACVRVAPEGTEWSAETTRDWLLEQGVSWSVVVTSLGERLFGVRWPAGGALRLLVTGGEQLRTWPRGLPFDVVNSYGVTETTGVRSVSRLPRTPPPSGLPSCGTAIARTRLHVLDDRFAPVAPGDEGELYVGGSGLAHGYLGRPGLTAERFLPDPFAGDGGRMYRTGDLVRLDPEGNLVPLGRRDQELKIDGVRVDVSEVEAVVLTHPAVAATAVSVWRDASARARLVCHVVVRAGAGVFPHELRSHLAERLPRAMVPTVFLRAEELPMLSSGKLDRARLPVPTPGNRMPESTARSLDATELEVARAFATVLGQDSPVAGHDDFLALGGDSQGLSRVRALLIRRLGVALPMELLFEKRTPIAIAATLRDGEHGDRRDDGLDTVREDDDGSPGARPAVPGSPLRLPMTRTQERMWFLEQLDPTGAPYVEVLTLRLSGPVEVPRLQTALRDLVARTPALRTVFRVEDTGPVQVVLPDAGVELQRAGPTVATAEELLADLAANGLLAPFDLSRAPLMRWRLYESRDAQTPSVLAMAVHHIVWDGRSAEIFLHDLVTLYDAAAEPSVLAPPAPGPPSVAVGSRASAIGPSTQKWLDGLAQARPHVWTDPVLTPGGADRLGVIERDVPDRLVAGIRALAGSQGVTPFVIGTACLTVALQPLHSNDELTIAAPVSVRTDEDADRMGFFVNLLPLSIPLHATTSGRALLASVRQIALDTWPHRSVPFQDIVGRTTRAARRSAAYPPYTQVMFLYNRLPGEATAADGVRWLIDQLPSRAPKCDLLVYWNESPAGWVQRVEYDRARLAPAAAARLSEDVLDALRTLAEDPDAPLVTLPDRVLGPSPATSRPAAGRTDAGELSDSPPRTEPLSELERQVAEAWAGVLGVDSVAADDNFFELGGSSMAAARLVVVLRSQLSVRVPVRLVFDTDTLAAFVLRLRQDHLGQPPAQG
ncbi:AMP-binding protein [Streptomyces sp. NPDC127119]|uniref:AMP-binding protein n=1 Tax=Streptomyces sp. NPDC127119 TaxID=3345370 RepID=UPI003635225C